MQSSTVQVTVDDYHEVDGVVYYTISLFYTTFKHYWHVSRRYSEFESLSKSLQERFLDIPPLPSKAFWKKFSSSFLSDRKDQLHEFMKELVSRQDILQCQEARNFLLIDENIPKSKVSSPSLFYEFNTSYAVISVVVSDDFAFIATAQQKIPQQIEKIRAVILDMEISEVVCLQSCNHEVWRIHINSTINCMCWSKELTMLLIGLNNGGISAYRVKTEMDYQEYEDFAFLTFHTDSVVGMCVDFTSSEVFSCSEDRKVIKTNLVNEVVLHEYVLDSIPIGFVGDLARQKVYVLNKKSGVLVIDTTNFLPCMSVSGSDMSFVCLAPHNIMFVGNSLGIVTVYRESVAINTLLLKSEVKCIVYSNNRKEVFVANDAGYISVWNRAGKLMHIWKASQKPIMCMAFSEQGLISAGLDGNVKIWRLPVFWVDPEFEKIENFEAEIQVKTTQVITGQKRIENDDLRGWDKK